MIFTESDSNGRRVMGEGKEGRKHVIRVGVDTWFGVSIDHPVGIWIFGSAAQR